MKINTLERVVTSLRRQRKQLAVRINVHCMTIKPSASANRALHALVKAFLRKCEMYRLYKHLLVKQKVAEALLLGFAISGNVNALMRGRIIKRELELLKTR